MTIDRSIGDEQCENFQRVLDEPVFVKTPFRRTS